MKIIVFPGSFDPIHNGHLQIARKAKAQIGAHLVLFLLSPSTVWKKVDTSFSDRANMINEALSEEGYALCRIEEENEGKTNYTYQTLLKLKKEYPNDELYLLIGADQANLFHKWKNPSEIAALATLLVYKRKGSSLSATNVTEYKMIVINGAKRAMSSTLIRHGESIDVPSGVLEYIVTHKLYFTALIAKRMSNKRFVHSGEVAKLSRLIALSNNIDPYPAFIAGLYHDIGKELPEAKTKAIMEKYYSKYLDLPEWSYHSFVGEYIAKHEFNIVNKEILHAIRFHTTAGAKMKKLDKVLYAADKIEPTRGFDASDLVAAMLDDVDKGFITVLKANIVYFKSKGIDYHNRLTDEAIAYYLK